MTLLQKYHFFIAVDSCMFYSDEPEKAHTFTAINSTTQDVLEAGFNVKCNSCSKETTKMVFHSVGNVLYTLICNDEKMTTSSLCRIIKLASEIVPFLVIVPQSMYNRAIRREEYEKVGPVLQTMTKLCQTNQSILLQGIEYVPLHNSEILSILEAKLKSMNDLLHVIILYDTKVFAIYSKSRREKLDNRDILHCIIFAKYSFDQLGENSHKYDTLYFHTSKNGRRQYHVYLEHLKQRLTLFFISHCKVSPFYEINY